MADIVETRIVDDLTGRVLDDGEVHRVRFTVNGKDYRLDVDAEGFKRFEDALSEFVNAATQVKRTRKRRAKKTEG